MQGFRLHRRGNDSHSAHLKKVLALVMAFAMAFTMMAGAAYTDQADITATEAVDTLAALNIMTGDTDGSFRPNDTVTRAEMCRMIYSIRNQGKSDASAYAKMQTTFTDVGESAWFSGYVKYCQSVGIVSGRSKTIFDPNAKVTGVEAALMCLRVMGYDPAKAGIGGSSWSMTTIGLADENGLLDDVDTTLTTDLPRQYAAQIMFNMIDAPTVKWSTDSDSYSDVGSDNTPNETVGHKYLDLSKTVSTLTKVEKTDGKDTYELTLDDTKSVVNWDETDGNENTAVFNFREVKKDYNNLKYKTVKVLYKKANEVYGVFATTDNTSNNGLLADLKMDSEKKVKLDGTKYTLAGSNSVYVDGELQTTGSDKDEKNVTIKDWVDEFGKDGTDDFATYKEGSKVELLANNGSSKVSILNVTTYAVREVTYVGSDYVTVKKVNNIGGKLEEDDYNIADGLKKNDYVVISDEKNYSDGKGLVEKAEVVEGKITSTKENSDNKVNKVAIDGTWYTANAAMTGDSALRLNASVKLVLVNGYIYAIDTITAGSSDVALVVEVGNNNTVGSKYYQARLILADGTDKVVDIEKKQGDENETAIDLGNKDQYSNMLAAYDVSKDVYTLTFINAQAAKEDFAGYENFYYGGSNTKKVTIDGSIRANATDAKFSAGTNNEFNKDVSRAYFDDNATVFLKYKDDDYKVVTGKAAKSWDKIEVQKVRMLASEENNSQYAGVAFVDATGENPGGSDKTYAVALDGSTKEKIDGTTYNVVEAWNGTETATYKWEGTEGVAAGQIIEYAANGDGTYDVDIWGGTDAMVKSYDEGSGEISIDGSIANLTPENSKIDSDDTVVLYVDSANGEGAEDGSIQLAPKYNGDETSTDKNVTVYVEQGDKQITVIVVDVNNKIDW